MAKPKRTIKVRKRIKRITKKKQPDEAAEGVVGEEQAAAVAPPDAVAEESVSAGEAVPVAEPLPVEEPVAYLEPPSDAEALPVAEPVSDSEPLPVAEALPVAKPIQEVADVEPIAAEVDDDPIAVEEESVLAPAPPSEDPAPAVAAGGDWQVDVSVPEPERVYPDGEDEDSLTITQQIIDHPPELQGRETHLPQSRYDHLLNSIYDAVLITGMEGDILQTNARAEEKFRMTEEALSTLNMVDLIAGADQKLIDVLRDNSDHRKFTLLEAICVTEDEGRFNAEIVVNRMFGEDENQFCFFVRDISKRKQTEQQMQEMSSKLEYVDKDSRVFETMRSLLHQFNDPVQVLICLAELDANDDYRKPLGQIESVLQRLIEFASPGMATATAGQVVQAEKPPPPEPCDRGRVLVVDDDPMVAKMFQKTLASGIPDLAVDVASDEGSTLDLFGEHHHALLVVDAQMPQISAAEASSVLGEMCLSRGWEVPTLVFCAGHSIDNTLSGLLDKHPEYVCLKKPFKPVDLVEAVKNNLQ